MAALWRDGQFGFQTAVVVIDAVLLRLVIDDFAAIAVEVIKVAKANRAAVVLLLGDLT